MQRFHTLFLALTCLFATACGTAAAPPALDESASAVRVDSATLDGVWPDEVRVRVEPGVAVVVDDRDALMEFEQVELVFPDGEVVWLDEVVDAYDAPLDGEVFSLRLASPGADEAAPGASASVTAGRSALPLCDDVRLPSRLRRAICLRVELDPAVDPAPRPVH